ncbi:MAG TPA: cell division protein FtsL [Terracidiphilus sp.]|nr:cell division protein FtsL [Terracidiphilus sp.]
MAACTTYLEPSPGWNPRVAEHNSRLMAEQPLRRRGIRTPEIMFTRHFDNTRLVKAPDPVRVRQMRVFTATLVVLFSLVMVYGLQHFSAIEGSYRVESEKQQVEQLREQNRQLRLSEAQLEQPDRIDTLARQMGLAAPQPSQVVHDDAHPDPSAPVFAQLNPPPAPAR